MSTINSFLVKSLRSNRQTIIEKPGRTQYLTDAVTYLRDFTSRDGEDYTRLFIRGVDAVSGVPVSNIQLHSEVELKSPASVVLLKRYSITVKDTGAVYQHAMSFGVIEDTALFDELVEKARSDADSDDVDPEIAV